MPQILIGLALALIIFAIDLASPRGMAMGVAYVVVVLLTSMSSDSRRATWITAIAATILTIVGFLASRAGDIGVGAVLFNRTIAVIAIWITALAILRKKRLEASAHAAERRLAAIVRSVKAAFIGMDQQGVVTDWNARAEAMFGWRFDEAVGRVLAETIIPPEYRDAHSKGLTRYLETGDGPVLTDTIEVTAQHKDGRCFPVELSVSVVESDQQPHFYAFLHDITDRKRMENDLREGHAALHSLAGRLISAQEDERRRVARDLHDDLCQKLALCGSDIEQLNGELDETAAPIRARLADLSDSIQQLAVDVRKLSHRLHPAVLELVGLEAALEDECEALSKLEDTQIRFVAEDLPQNIPPDVALALYRIAQEALRNIIRHADADKAEVALVGDGDTVRLRIRDFGVGFDPEERRESGSLGLVSMRERVRLIGGRLTVDSTPGDGSIIEVAVPLESRESAEASKRPNSRQE